jgi:hypothetical protein
VPTGRGDWSIRRPLRHRREVDMQDRIPTNVMALEVMGPGIPEARLGAVVSHGPTLLVFLRHFG